MEQIITKAYGGSDVDLELQPGSRQFVATVSTDGIDSDREIVLPKGIDLGRYRKNPVIAFNHNLDLPIGKSLWIKANDKSLISKGYISDKTEVARDVWGLMQDGVISTFSIGFIKGNFSAPTKRELSWHPDWEGAKGIHRTATLYEYSPVTVPANEDAVAMAVAKGRISQTTVDLLTGKAAKEAQAVKQIVTEAPKETLSHSDLVKRIYKEAERITLKVDIDRVIAKALERLRFGK